MLTPAEAGLKARSNIATRNKREWLRHSRWLYSHSLALLVDEAESEQRSQIFANILGYGHLLPQQKLLMDYLRYLPQSVSLYKKLRKRKQNGRNSNKSVSITGYLQPAPKRG